MPVSLISSPATLCFSRNPAIYKLRSLTEGGDTYAAKGVSASITANISSRFSTGQTITVAFTEADGTSTSIVFTAAASYTSETAIPDNSFAGSNLEYWTIICDKLAEHPRIAPYFTATKTGPPSATVITLLSTSTDAGWDVEITNTGGFTVAAAAAVADATPDNYRVLLEVYFERTYGAGDFALAAQLDGQPDTDGYTWFDISAVLDAQCRAYRTEPLVPVWGTDAPALADNLRRYYVRYTEESGNPVTVSAWSYDSTRKVLAGGIAQSLFAEGDYLAGKDATDAFLTWMPDGKQVSIDQPEYLAWYNHTGAARTVYITRKWYDIGDNTEGGSGDYYFADALEVPAGEVGIFPVGPAEMEMDAEAAAFKYTVQVVSVNLEDPEQIDELSEERTYYLDNSYYESKRYVQYLNNFGCPETWRCTGDLDRSLRIQRATAQKVLQPGYNEYASERVQYAAPFDQPLQYRTGYLRRAEADTLQEMLVEGHVYDVSPDGYIPLLITSEDFAVTSTRRDLHSYAFSARPRLDMKNYSRRRLTAGAVDANAWLDTSGQPWFDTFLIPWTQP